MNGVKVTKTVVGALQVGQNLQHMCVTDGVCLVSRVNTGSAVQQQCSSAADQCWPFVPDAILLGHRRAPQWVRARTLTVHWGLNSRKAVGGPCGADSGCTANKKLKQFKIQTKAHPHPRTHTQPRPTLFFKS